ncbi:MAG: pyridoxamine 5'-phosphate oxidase family protein [Cyclobacteriaceae bacterium]|nr:pyridoxamine 5'-phosphate oxidase family protein [Cyclobacteriaceae bacterium]
MLGTLSSPQIEALLTAEIVGRIGCSDQSKTYIIPITYVFKGNCIYAQSQPGHKIDTMRKNPNVCFQVDSIENQENWRSVITWGTYEEINDASTYEKAYRILYDRLLPMHTNTVSRGGLDLSRAPLEVDKRSKPILFRIRISELSGRFEKE